MKIILLVILTSFTGLTLISQPLTDIEGRLSVRLPFDETSIHVGHMAGISQDSVYGRYNSFFGTYSGVSTTSGNLNSFFGFHSGKNNTTGSNNTFVGVYTGERNTTGNGNCFYGNESGTANTTGDFNCFFGNNAGLSNTSGHGNSSFGAFAGALNAGGHNNSFFGYGAGQNVSNVHDNSFFGFLSGHFTTSGMENSFFGSGSGYLNQSGIRNSFIGVDAGFSNISGSNNHFFGFESGYANETGERNIAIGNLAYHQANAYYNNIAIGDSSMYYVGDSITVDPTFKLARRNVAIGNNSLKSNGNVGSNRTVAIGHEAGYNGGSRSVFIGHQVGKNATLKDDVLMIDNESGDDPLIYGEFANDLVEINGDFTARGNAHLVDGTNFQLLVQNPDAGGSTWRIGSSDSDWNAGANKLVIGTSTNSANAHLTIESTGDVGIGTTDPTAALDVDGNIRVRNVGGGPLNMDIGITATGDLTTSTSDGRLKMDIREIEAALEKVLALRGVTFKWKETPDHPAQIGVIAQEVKEQFPEVVFKNGEHYGVNYSQLSAVLIEAIKDQQAIINKQQAQIDKIMTLLGI